MLLDMPAGYPPPDCGLAECLRPAFKKGCFSLGRRPGLPVSCVNAWQPLQMESFVGMPHFEWSICFTGNPVPAKVRLPKMTKKKKKEKEIHFG